MRNHRITCHLEDKKPIMHIQYLTNYFTVLYIENLLENSGLSKDKQVSVLDQILLSLRGD